MFEDSFVDWLVLIFLRGHRAIVGIRLRVRGNGFILDGLVRIVINSGFGNGFGIGSSEESVLGGAFPTISIATAADNG